MLTALMALSPDVFYFDKAAVEQGEWWRLLSAHFVHSSFSHALWDVMAFGLSIVWLRCYSTRAVLLSIVSGMLVVDGLLISTWSELDRYCGLSGLLFSPLVVAAGLHWKASRGLIGWLPAVIIAAKLLADVMSERTLMVDTQWQAYPLAHVAGASSGLIVLVLCLALGRGQAKSCLNFHLTPVYSLCGEQAQR